MRCYLTYLSVLLAGLAHAQVRGSLFDAAIPATNPMNPNGDGYITSSGAAFTGPLDELEFEIPFIPIQQYENEPGADNESGVACRFYDLVSDASKGAHAGYYYYKDPDGIPDNGDEVMVFRLRLASFNTSSSAFSILIDTDYQFGFTGPEADPNAVNGNPGFELEITLYNNTGSSGGVRVFDTDGVSTDGVERFHGALSSNYQVSYAYNSGASCSDTPVFVDTFVPFSALGISSSSQVRMAVSASSSVGSSLAGGATDIGGVNGTGIVNDDEQFMRAILNYSPIATGNSSNRAPFVSDAAISLLENSANGTSVHTVGGTDANNDLLSYSITSGNTGSAFSINNASGEITVNNSSVLDFETNSVFTLLVKVSDGKLYDNAVVTISLKDVNEVPTVQPATVHVDENAPLGAFIHQVVATDPDANDALTFSLVEGNSNGEFSIDPRTGVVAVNDPAVIDYELHPVFVLRARVEDKGGLIADALIRVELNNVAERSDINPSKGFSPDGDGINEFWLIQGLDAFPDNEVKVFNRWGNLVFEIKNYDNKETVWNGEAAGRPVLRGASVVDGTYYFIIHVNGIAPPITGYVIVKN